MMINMMKCVFIPSLRFGDCVVVEIPESVSKHYLYTEIVQNGASFENGKCSNGTKFI